MNYFEVIPPPIEPINLDQAKAWLRVDLANDDAMITEMIKSAREHIENMTRRSYIQRTLRMTTDELPRAWNDRRCGCWCIDDRSANGYGRLYVELARSPVVEVSTLEYRGSDGGLIDIPTGWFVDTDFVPARLYVGSIVWPTGQPLRVTYNAGYATTGSPNDFGLSLVPSAIKQAILFQVQLAYDELPPEKRGKLEEAIRNLTSSYTVHTF